jgi:hypothetical protein
MSFLLLFKQDPMRSSGETSTSIATLAAGRVWTDELLSAVHVRKTGFANFMEFEPNASSR